MVILFPAKPAPHQLDLKRSLINTVEETVTKMVVDLESGSNDCLRDLFMQKCDFVFRLEFEHLLSVFHLCPSVAG